MYTDSHQVVFVANRAETRGIIQIQSLFEDLQDVDTLERLVVLEKIPELPRLEMSLHERCWYTILIATPNCYG